MARGTMPKSLRNTSMPGRTDSVERKGSCAGRMVQTVTTIITAMHVFMAQSIRRRDFVWDGDLDSRPSPAELADAKSRRRATSGKPNCFRTWLLFCSLVRLLVDAAQRHTAASSAPTSSIVSDRRPRSARSRCRHPRLPPRWPLYCGEPAVTMRCAEERVKECGCD